MVYRVEEEDYDSGGLVLTRFWEVTHPHRNDGKARYRSDAPKNRALVTIHCRVPQELCHIGEEFEWLLDENGEKITDHIPDEINLPDGVYIWEGSVRVDCYDDYYSGGYESESYAEGDFRLATKEEWSAWVKGEYPWDPMLWYSVETDEVSEKQVDKVVVDEPFSGLFQDQQKD